MSVSECLRGGRRRANSPTVQELPHYAAREATGGLCAEAADIPRWVRIFSIIAGYSMKAIIRIPPAKRG